MSIVMTYRSQNPVGGEKPKQIQALVDELNHRHDWWSESLQLDADAEGHLAGRTLLVLVGYETPEGLMELDPEEDEFMAFQDACVIIDHLCQWSADFEVAWTLTFANEPMGGISAGEEDDELLGFLTQLGEDLGATFDDEDEQVAAELDRIHSARLNQVSD